MAKVVAVDSYVRFDKMFVAVYVIGRANWLIRSLDVMLESEI